MSNICHSDFCFSGRSRISALEISRLKIHRFLQIISAACSFLALWMPAGRVFAELPEGEPTVITIRGTAALRAEQEAPLSVSVIDRVEIEQRAASHFEQLIDDIPNVGYAGGSARPRFLQIRGIGELEQYEGIPNPAVGVIIDGIDLSGLAGAATLFDIEQVELLRGPQGVRYGANALAGALHMESTEPGLAPSGRAEISRGSDDLHSGGVAVGGVVPGSNESLRYRVSLYHHDQNGFRTNEFLESVESNRRRELTGRLKLVWQPDATLTVRLTTLIADIDDGYDAFSIDNSFTTRSDRPGEDDQLSRGAALTVRKRLAADTELSAVLSGVISKTRYSYDGDWGNDRDWGEFAPYDYFSDTARTRRNSSLELRAASAVDGYRHGLTPRWVTGVYLQQLDEDTDIEQLFAGEAYDSLISEYDSVTNALFAQYELPLAEGTAFEIGVRGDLREYDYDDDRGNRHSPSEAMLGGSAVLSHDFSRNTRGYLAANRGYRGGGVNVSAAIAPNLQRFDPEYLWNFEAGVRSRLFDDRLDLSITLFNALRREQQIRLAVQSDPDDPLTFAYVSQNAARGWNRGVELEMEARVAGATTLKLQGALLDTEYTAVPEQLSHLAGRDQAHAPKWRYAGWLRHQIDQLFFGRVGVSGTAAYYFDDAHDQRSSPYHLAHLGFGFDDGHWSIELWGRNVFDRRYAVRGFYFGLEPPEFPSREYLQLGDRAQFGGTLRVQF